jgi:hypothetical protein
MSSWDDVQIEVLATSLGCHRNRVPDVVQDDVWNRGSERLPGKSSEPVRNRYPGIAVLELQTASESRFPRNRRFQESSGTQVLRLLGIGHQTDSVIKYIPNLPIYLRGSISNIVSRDENLKKITRKVARKVLRKVTDFLPRFRPNLSSESSRFLPYPDTRFLPSRHPIREPVPRVSYPGSPSLPYPGTLSLPMIGCFPTDSPRSSQTSPPTGCLRITSLPNLIIPIQALRCI